MILLCRSGSIRQDYASWGTGIYLSGVRGPHAEGEGHQEVHQTGHLRVAVVALEDPGDQKGYGTCDTAHDQRAVVILVGVRGISLLTREYGKGYRELARRRGCVFVPDLLDGLFGDGDLMSDQIHPNAAGYAVIANQFIATINAHFKAQIPPVDLTPFVFGDESDGSVAVTAQQAPSFVFSPGTLGDVPRILGIDLAKIPKSKRLESSARSAPHKRTRSSRRP